jgi:hypothetical protein
MENRICTKCKIEQPITNFHKLGDGFRYQCGKCCSESAKIYLKNNPEIYEEQKKKQRDRNKNITEEQRIDRNLKRRARKRGVSIEVILEEERISEIAKSQNKKYCYGCNEILDKECFGKHKISNDGLTTICKICRRKVSSDYYSSNKEKVDEHKKIYLSNNRKMIMTRHRRYFKERKKNDPLFALSVNVRGRIKSYLKHKGIKKANIKTFDMIGCTPIELKKYLEEQFTEGMSWSNYSFRGWHIDHIIPLSSAKTLEEVIKLNHYTNLRPLWGIENMKKGKKII